MCSRLLNHHLVRALVFDSSFFVAQIWQKRDLVPHSSEDLDREVRNRLLNVVLTSCCYRSSRSLSISCLLRKSPNLEKGTIGNLCHCIHDSTWCRLRQYVRALDCGITTSCEHQLDHYALMFMEVIRRSSSCRNVTV